MEKVEPEVSRYLKEDILKSYCDLNNTWNQLSPQEVATLAVDVREYIDFLTPADLKECYFAQRDFLNRLSKKIKQDRTFKSYFKRHPIFAKSKISSQDRDFFERFGQQCNFNDRSAQLEELAQVDSYLAGEKLITLYNKTKKYYARAKLGKLGCQLRDLLHPILRNLMNKRISQMEAPIRFKMLSPKGNLVPVSGVECLIPYFKSENENCIFVANHTNVYDAPIICTSIKEHVYVMAGDEIKNDMNGLLFFLNGVDWVNRADKKSRFLAKENGTIKLAHGLNYLILPEGTWNMTESKPMLPFNWGVIEMAQKSGVTKIVPVVIEYIRTGSKITEIIVAFAKPYEVSIHRDKKTQIDELQNLMASMRWQIWESLKSSHDETSKSEFNKNVIEASLKEYPKLNLPFETSVIRDPNPSPRLCLVPNSNNAFLLRKKPTK